MRKAQPYGWSIRGIRHVLSSWIVRAVAWRVRHMRAGSLPPAANRLARLLLRFIGRRRALAHENIRFAIGPDMSDERCDEIVFKSTRNIILTMLELFRLPVLSDDELKAKVPVIGFEHVRNARDAGNGAIMLAAHFGNWELLGARVAVECLPISAVARDADHAVTATIINNARESKNLHVISRDDTRSMLRSLRNNELLAILPDQRAHVRAEVLDFMGRPAATATGPANLVARTRCAVIPSFCRYDDAGAMCAELLPPLNMVETGDRNADIRENTQRINDAIGAYIRKYPEQWLWLHNRWKLTGTETLPSKPAENNA